MRTYKEITMMLRSTSGKTHAYWKNEQALYYLEWSILTLCFVLCVLSIALVGVL